MIDQIKPIVKYVKGSLMLRSEFPGRTVALLVAVDHPDFPANSQVVTSQVLVADFTTGRVETRNTVYVEAA